MNKLDLINMSFRNLWRRKTRTILTVLGVVIGSASIVIMLSLGIAMDKSFQEQLSHMGSLNIIEVHNARRYDPSGSQNTPEMKLDDQAVNTFENIPGVSAVMPIKNLYVKIAAGKMLGHVNVIGIKPENLQAFDFKAEEGRLLLDTDKDALVFGKNIAYDFYNPRLRGQRFYGRREGTPQVDLLSAKLILTTDMSYGERQRNQTEDEDNRPPKTYSVKGIGILEESNSEKDYNAYMNLSSLQKIIEEDRRNNRDTRNNRNSGDDDQYQSIKVKVNDIQQVEEVQEAIKALGFQTYSLTDMVKSMQETSRKIQAILGGIGAVSLLVAAIGITNTMIMSIYERTREIGVMKVLGADLADIKRLFLLEAGMIGFVGGLTGLVFSYGISIFLNRISQGYMRGMESEIGISVISIELALGALAFATLVGIISGYSPARRAMRLSALEAIKND